MSQALGRGVFARRGIQRVGIADTLAWRIVGMEKRMDARKKAICRDVLLADLGRDVCGGEDALDESSAFLFLAVRFTIATAVMALLQMQVIARIEPQEGFAGMAAGVFHVRGLLLPDSGFCSTRRRVIPGLLPGRACAGARCCWRFSGDGG